MTAPRHRLLTSLLLVFVATGWADTLGDLELDPPTEWKSVSPFPAGLSPSPHPTLKYVPVDGRRSALIATLLPTDILGFPVRDQASLHRFNRIAAAPFITDPLVLPPVGKTKLPEGLALWLTTAYPQPHLVPDAPPMVTSASVLVGKDRLIHIAIFHEGEESPDFQEAMQALRSMRRHVSDTSPP